MLEKPILTGFKIILRPMMADDAPAMFASLADEESMRLTGSQQAFAFEQVQQFCQKLYKADDRADYAITRRRWPLCR